MRRQDGPVSDELVDVYRELLAIRAVVAPLNKPSTPGAGVDPKRVVRPSKRLKNWHRSSPLGYSLKRYARHLAGPSGLAPDPTSMSAAARRWLASKGVHP